MPTPIETIVNLSISKKIIIMISIIILILVLYYFLRYNSLENDIKDLETQYINLNSELTQYKQKQVTYLEDVRRLNQLQASYLQLRRALPSTTQIASFLSQLHEQSEIAGLDLTLIQPLEEESSEIYIKIPVRLELKGEFHEITKFFYNVGKLERIINMENINLENSSTDNPETILTTKVLATTFRALEEEEPTKNVSQNVTQ